MKIIQWYQGRDLIMRGHLLAYKLSFLIPVYILTLNKFVTKHNFHFLCSFSFICFQLRCIQAKITEY
jgi:hypothetical protein